MKYISKSNSNRQYYLSREVAQMLGPEAIYIPTPYMIAMFPKGTSARMILLGVALVMAELESELEASSWDLEEEGPPVEETKSMPTAFDELREKIRRS